MKKLLYTLLAVSIIFSACEKEEEEPTNNTNNNNSGNTTNLAIGDSHQGGIIFYLDENGGGLIAAPSDQSTGAEWGCYGTLISGADGAAIGTGFQNTIDIEAGCTTPVTAADICANLTLGGYSDWFLPSKGELNLMWTNLADSDADGVNTGVTDPNNLGGLNDGGYWSSTEDGGDNGFALGSMAWDQDFYGGSQSLYNKNGTSAWVRAVRAF